MEAIGKLLQRYSEQIKKGPAHEKAAIVDQIKEQIGFTGNYGYTFWLGRLKQSKISFGSAMVLIKEVHNSRDNGKPKGALLNYLIKKHYGKTKKPTTSKA